MKFTAQFNTPRLNLSGYRAALDRAMREAISQALMEWLSRVLDEIPDWTGASRATFDKLAGLTGTNVVHSNGRADQGAAAGEGSLLELDTPAGYYTFTYKTTLPWLIWNEYHDANVDPDPTKFPPPAKLKKPGPYEFQAKGAIAFIQFAKSVDLPAVGPFIVAKKVKVG